MTSLVVKSGDLAMPATWLRRLVPRMEKCPRWGLVFFTGQLLCGDGLLFLLPGTIGLGLLLRCVLAN